MPEQPRPKQPPQGVPLPASKRTWPAGHRPGHGPGHGIKAAPAPTPAPLPRRPTGIYWPAVAGAGVVAVMFVGVLLAVVVVLRPMSRQPVIVVQGTPIEVPTPPTPVTPVEPVPTKPAAVPVEVPVVEVPNPLPPPELPPEQPAPVEVLPLAPDVVLAPSNPAPLPEELLVGDGGKPAPPVCKQFGTAVSFHRTPTLACKKAEAEDRLLFVLHVSGDFEDAGFT